MTDVPGTSPERHIIWSPGCPATESCRRPVDVRIQNFCIFVFPVKTSSRCVKQELLHLKNTFSIKLSFFLLIPQESPEGPPEVLDVRTFRRSSGYVPRRRMPAGVSCENNLFMQNRPTNVHIEETWQKRLPSFREHAPVTTSEYCTYFLLELKRVDVLMQKKKMKFYKKTLKKTVIIFNRNKNKQQLEALRQQ